MPPKQPEFNQAFYLFLAIVAIAIIAFLVYKTCRPLTPETFSNGALTTMFSTESFAPKFMNLDKTHNELVHNYCRLIKLTQCKTSHHIIANTFKQLIVTVSELLQNETLDVNTYSMKMVLNNAYDYDKFPKVRTTMLQILKEAYPDEHYNSDFENLPSWAKIFYAVRRFAELFD